MANAMVIDFKVAILLDNLKNIRIQNKKGDIFLMNLRNPSKV